MKMLKKLPMGTQSFETLRKFNEIYIDKTDLIYQLASSRGKVFLARPRRFGKSLLVSTFASLFEHGLRDFRGLAIEKVWKDSTYNVIQLDFSTIANFNSVERFDEGFKAMLAVRFGDLGFQPSGDDVRFMAEFSNWLSKQDGGSLVLLIDEYDSPLTQVLNDEKLFLGIQSILKEFFNILKFSEGVFRFLFLTGVTRFSNTSIFSGFNNLLDISLEPKYGTLVGYTESEIGHYFCDYLDNAAQTLGISFDALMGQMREYYDGFSFDRECSTHVYCPWSVLNFLGSSRFKFENYWFQSGGQPGVLMNYLAQRKLEEPLDFLKTIPMSSKKLFSSAPYHKLDVNVLLHQTGYLTIRSTNAAGNFLLGYPNREVEASMAQLYAQAMVDDADFESDDILNYMLEGDVEDTVRFVNKVFNSLDYQRYPVRDEASFRGTLQILMIGLSLRPHVEVHTARGRSDMEVEAGDYYWVFEFKFAKLGGDSKALCREALEQIRQKDYGNTLHGKKLIRVGMVFDEEQRQITDWQTL